MDDFNQIYQANWQKIFRLCMGYLNDADAAKDLAQETFITVWQQLSKFRNESAISTWIYRIAVNKCLRQLEKSKKIINNHQFVDIADEPAADEEATRFLYQCISELKEMDRVIISLELEDVKQAEIASITGLSEANVRVRIHRIKEKLMKKFEKHE
ncbi:MAG TPA: RNA polymerase sigma factor [Flavobacterium sp.]|jgi:RNA polymerase sigma-70 factor (ECF subfamily)